MDRSLKWRTIALLLGVVLCACFLAPTWPGSSALPSWFPFKKKISLGLDLQGGMHIVYSIDLDRAVEDKASDIKRDLDARFTDEKLDVKVKLPRPSFQVPLGAVTVVLPDGKNKAEIESQIHSDYGNTVNARDCMPDDGSNAICFQVSASYAEGIKKSALTNAVTTIRERINEKGVSEPSVVEKGDDIIVELPGDPKDPAMLETREIIAGTSKLEFKVVDDGSAYMSKLYSHIHPSDKDDTSTDERARKLDIKAKVDQWRPEDGGNTHTDYYLEAYDREESMPKAWAAKLGCPANDAEEVRCKVTGQQLIQRYLFGDHFVFGDKAPGEKGLIETDPSFKIPDEHQIAFEPIYPDPSAKEQRTLWRSYYLESAVRLTGAGISNAQPSNDPNTGRPVVLLDFNRFGGRVFGDLTSQIVGKKLATILDDKVRSAPIINQAIRGGRASITLGGGDVQRQERERESLVNVLRTGSLPAPLVEQSKSEVGPTLGRDAIDKTKVSFIIGIVLVILIMVGVYRWSGWIAVFAVVFHIVMTLAVMAAFGATLTLPGVAAIVLSIGMEVDGNILIYERIRDELLLGKSVRGAIDLGFSRAFSAILDGQLTTATAGWVLLSYGSGPIKGFAVMLLVGVFTTLSTNIWVTRIFFDWYVSRKKGQLATISI